MPSKLRSLLFWLSLLIIFSVLSFLLINNKLALPFHDRAQDVVAFNESDQPVDAQGKVVNDWQSNNYADDAVKVVVVATAAFAYWRVLSVLIAKPWLKIIAYTVSIPIILGLGYMLSFSLYFTF